MVLPSKQPHRNFTGYDLKIVMAMKITQRETHLKNCMERVILAYA